ncbi:MULTISPECIES: hypothetical protein [Bacillus cereus group]|uniref:Uncharacterized protein n=1 Tax=Bacillus thuringiensis TaxID=1428 RepID=A0A9X7GFY4_BACTU|nr:MULTISPECIES: hypothetical protein [Bacillus cereus group]PFV35841.1 hypothetical protein COK99_02135 [Bacillus thuringiensis]PGV22890.1 hypothetical protein COD93_28915 [Bacillus cereus]
MESINLLIKNLIPYIRNPKVMSASPNGAYDLIQWMGSTGVQFKDPILFVRIASTEINQRLDSESALLVLRNFISLAMKLLKGNEQEMAIRLIESTIQDIRKNQMITKELDDRERRKKKDIPNIPAKSAPDAYQKNFNSYTGADMVCSINVPGRGPVVFGELSSLSYSIFREKYPVRALGRVSMKGFTRGMRTISGVLGFTVFDESIVYRCMREIKEAGYRMLMDEMPLFDITLSMANEFGAQSSMSLYGVSTYTEGMVLSIDDIFTQNVYEFYALDIDPMQRTNLASSIKLQSL